MERVVDMTEKQISELVSLRHRLRVLLDTGVRGAEASLTLNRMASLSRESGDRALRSEHARWSTHLSMGVDDL